MAETKTIGISALVSLGLVLVSMIAPGFFDEPQYYCEQRPELGLIQCDSFSKYVSDNGKCIRNDNTNLICREGWLLVTDDLNLSEENEKINKVEGRESYTCYPEPRGCELI